MAPPASGIIARIIACLPRHLASLVLALTLGGCGGANNSVFDRLAESTPVPPPARAAAIVPTAEDIRGHWVVSMAGTGTCGMTFGTPGVESRIAVERNCSGRFTASRSWAIEPDGVVIRDARGGTLAALHMNEPGRLEGETPEGQQVLLTR